MKTSLPIVLLAGLSVAGVAQDAVRAHIPYKIPDGTPPPPAPAKPVWVVPAADVVAEKTHSQGGRTITIREIKPIPLPPPPAPAEPVAPVEVIYAIHEGEPAGGLLEALDSLHEILDHDGPELRRAYEGRARAAKEREEYLKAHPPQPEDITLNYWRVEKPTGPGKGAAR